jgi:hypothetical protein
MFFVVYLCGVWSFSLNYKHLLITLLRLACFWSSIVLFIFIYVILIIASSSSFSC